MSGASIDADSLREAWDKAGWPSELLDRALGLGLARQGIAGWLQQGERGLERMRNWVPQLEALTFGSIRGRELSWDDNDRFADLWSNAGEQVGDWEITVERWPNAFAQFRLQENVSIPVLEERGVLLACVVWAKRNLVVAGRRLTVHCGQGLRVRKECRGKGYGNLVRAVSSAFSSPPSTGQYHYIRSQNYGAVDFFRHTSPRVVDSSPEREGDVPGVPVTVQQYPRRILEGDVAGIRKATSADIPACVALMNRTHDGLDLFRPYTSEGLELRLDEGYWGPRARWMDHVYGWDDYFVLEESGRIVACAGLWDRGRDMRERWRHKVSRDEKSICVTALLDFGFEAGQEKAMAGLIAYLIGETARLERDFLLAPLQQLPEVAALLANYAPIEDTRGLGWLLWDEESEKLGRPAVEVTRPHTDLAYW